MDGLCRASGGGQVFPFEAPRSGAGLERLGPKACLLAWLPIFGDPLCAVAGWLRMPFWPCVFYMAIGKFARYVTMTVGLIYMWPKLGLGS